MRSTQEDITLLDAYIKGTLDADAISALEVRLAHDVNLKTDLEDLRVMQQGMRVKALAEKLEMMRGWEEEIVRNKKTKINWKKWLVLIFFISVLGYLLYNYALIPKKEMPTEYKSLYAEKFDNTLILHKTMRAAVQLDSLTAEQRRAYELYSIQLFDEAIPLLQDLWTNQKDTLSLFYLGVSYVGAGNVDKGLEILQKPELSKYSKQTNLFINH